MLNNKENFEKLLNDVYSELNLIQIDFDDESENNKFNIVKPSMIVNFRRLDKSNIFEFYIEEDIGSAAGYIGFNDCTIIDDPQYMLYYKNNLYTIEDLLCYEKFKNFDEKVSNLIDNIGMNIHNKKSVQLVSQLKQLFLDVIS